MAISGSNNKKLFKNLILIFLYDKYKNTMRVATLGNYRYPSYHYNNDNNNDNNNNNNNCCCYWILYYLGCGNYHLDDDTYYESTDDE